MCIFMNVSMENEGGSSDSSSKQPLLFPEISIFRCVRVCVCVCVRACVRVRARVRTLSCLTLRSHRL